MSVSALSGTAFTGVGTPMLGVDSAGNLAPLSSSQADPATTSELHVPADNTAAVITRAAETDIAHVVYEITWSLFGTGTLAATASNLKIEDGSDTIFDMDISAKGQDQVIFPLGKRGHSGRAMTITLEAGGAANIQGKLSATCLKKYVPLGGGGELDFGDESNSGLLLLFF